VLNQKNISRATSQTEHGIIIQKEFIEIVYIGMAGYGKMAAMWNLMHRNVMCAFDVDVNYICD
jgi:hypothetical protein